MDEKEMLVRVRCLRERLREALQHNFDCHIQNRGEIPDIDYVVENFNSRQVQGELEDFYGQISDEVYRKLCEHSREEFPKLFV